MEPFNIPLIPGAVVFFAGLALGVGLAYLFVPGRKRQRQLLEELQREREAHSDYRHGVAEHFETTAELVNNLTQSYKAVYRHLAEGAHSLCADELVNPALRFAEPRLIADQKPAQAVSDANSAPGAEPAPATPPPQRDEPSPREVRQPKGFGATESPPAGTGQAPETPITEPPKDFAVERRARPKDHRGDGEPPGVAR